MHFTLLIVISVCCYINIFFFCNFAALKQAMAAYFQEESIGDVGGKKAKYVPKRGHPGTLVGGAIVLSYGCLE